MFQCINVLHNIMELMLLWISKRLKSGITATIYKAMFIHCIQNDDHFEFTPVYILIILCISFLEWMGTV